MLSLLSLLPIRFVTKLALRVGGLVQGGRLTLGMFWQPLNTTGIGQIIDT